MRDDRNLRNGTTVGANNYSPLQCGTVMLKYFSRRFAVLIFLLAAVLILFTCVKVPDYCDRHVTYDPDRQFCFAGLAYPLCNNGDYNPLTEGCDENNFVGTMCADGSFVPPGTHCGGYTLNTASAPASGGRIIRTTEGPNYAAGYNLVVIAEAAAGYTFAGWTGASTSTDMTVTIRMDSNKPLVAMFRPATSTLATTAFPPDGGTIERVENGIMVTVTATTTAGYTFVGWSGASTSTEPTVTVTVDEGKTLVAMFAPATYTLTVNATPSAGGTLFVNGTASSGVTHHNAGTQVRVLARAADGYEFTGWAGASTSAGEEITISMNTSQMLTANFRRQQSGNDTTITPPAQYTLTVNRSPANGGTTSPESGLRHDAGTPIAITAAAASGYTFVNWTVTGGGTVANLTSTNTTVSLTSNATVTANFRLYEVTPGAFTLTINREPAEGGAVFVNNVAASGTSSHEPETQISIRAEAALGYRFTGWTGSLTSAAASLPSLTMRANAELTANFEYMGTHTLTINRVPVTGGRVFVDNVESAGITVQTVGASVSVSAEAAPDYRFTGWTLGSSTSTNVNPAITVLMNRDSTLIANFESIIVAHGSFTDSRDGQTYRTVRIGDQTWMAENLNFAGHLFGESWCYNNVPDSCARYGRLYNWGTAMAGSLSSTAVPSGVQGVCPVGWHLPSRNEWTTLVDFVGRNVAGTRLKSSPPDWNGTDDFGFSALPGGNRNSDGPFGNVGTGGHWWSATEVDVSASNAWNRSMNTGYDNVVDGSSRKSFGFSVLCVRSE
jgi:uncharacterized protein (TIGR02145 family)/uncharacterized repeat protein (TIGR02543 family)